MSLQPCTIKDQCNGRKIYREAIMGMIKKTRRKANSHRHPGNADKYLFKDISTRSAATFIVKEVDELKLTDDERWLRIQRIIDKGFKS